MSKTKKIIELEPDGRNYYESFVLKDFKCPNCSGRGSFVEEVGKGQLKDIDCPFCSGAGKVKCTMVVKWEPQSNEKEKR